MNEEENLQLNQDEMIDDELLDEEGGEGEGETKSRSKISLIELLIFHCLLQLLLTSLILLAGVAWGH